MRRPSWNANATNSPRNPFGSQNEGKVLLITFCQIRNEHQQALRQMQEQQTEYTITKKFSFNYWPLSILSEWNAWLKANAQTISQSTNRIDRYVCVCTFYTSAPQWLGRERVHKPQTFRAQGREGGGWRERQRGRERVNLIGMSICNCPYCIRAGRPSFGHSKKRREREKPKCVEANMLLYIPQILL